MAKIDWNSVGTRFFETGIDRGVLYPPTGPGVPWFGLLSVNENPDGGEPRPYFFDGIKYRNLASSEDFKATITALGAPSEFDVCDGITSLAPGLFATQQPRRPFSLSYRTLIGNDTESIEHGYKLHLVYNALAAPVQRNYESVSKEAKPTSFSWDISTLPEAIEDAKHSAHLVIDSRESSSAALSSVENLLYGTTSANPAMPTVATLISIFS